MRVHASSAMRSGTCEQGVVCSVVGVELRYGSSPATEKRPPRPCVDISNPPSSFTVGDVVLFGSSAICTDPVSGAAIFARVNIRQTCSSSTSQPLKGTRLRSTARPLPFKKSKWATWVSEASGIGGWLFDRVSVVVSDQNEVFPIVGLHSNVQDITSMVCCARTEGVPERQAAVVRVNRMSDRP